MQLSLKVLVTIFQVEIVIYNEILNLYSLVECYFYSYGPAGCLQQTTEGR